MCNRWGAGLLVLGLALVLPAHAQMGGDGTMGRLKGMGGPGAQQMSGTMHDISSQMVEMSSHMSKGNLSVTEQHQMAERMREMAGMMDHMSGMAGKGMMMDADMEKQLDQIRKRMDEMMKPSAGDSKK